MPPHDDTIDVIEATAFPMHETNATTITFDPLHRTYTTDRITIDERPWTMTKFITEDDLEKVIHKIYQIIEDHTTLDITEEEFMKLIKDDS